METALIQKNYPVINFKRLTFCFSLIYLCVLTGVQSLAQATTEWPCFHGFDRTNKSAETGLMKEWPQIGPNLKWTISGLGNGYSSITVAGGLVYTAGMISNQTYVFCFDMDGNPIWQKPNGTAWSTTRSHAQSYIGSRSTPTFDEGILYHLGESGRLTAFNSKTGMEIWHRELMQEFDAEITEYGYSESVLIDGDYLYVRP